MKFQPIIMSLLPFIIGVVVYQLTYHNILELGGGEKSLIFGFIIGMFGVIHFAVFWACRCKTPSIKTCFMVGVSSAAILIIPVLAGVVSIIKSI